MEWKPRIVEHAVRQDEAEARLVALHRQRRELEIEAARLLALIDGAYHYAYRGCSSIAQYGEQRGLSGREARSLASVGRSLELRPALEEEILSGKLSLDAAAALSKLYENPELMHDGEDWLRKAEQLPIKRFELEIGKRMREAETGEAVSVMQAILTSSGRELFERARQLACRKHDRLLSEGHTVELLSEHYLESFDPERKQPRKRRMADTSGQPGRHVPADVKRAVVGRQGDRCAVPGCDHEIFLNKAHVRAHCRGGTREARNLLYFCREHHALFDRGFLKVGGTPEKPMFRVPEYEVVAATVPAGPLGGALEPP